MIATESLREALQWDVDDIAVWARNLTRPMSERVLSEASCLCLQPGPQIDLKAAWMIQVILAEAAASSLAIDLSASLAEALALIASSARSEHRLRRSALTSLALLYLKTRRLTQPIGFTIREAFLLALQSGDKELHEFASQSLAQGGVLSRRDPVSSVTVIPRTKMAKTRATPFRKTATGRIAAPQPNAGALMKRATNVRVRETISSRPAATSDKRIGPAKK